MSPEQRLEAGEQAERRGELAAAAAAYEAVAADPVAGAEVAVATAQFRLGRVAWRQSRFDDALRAYETARALAQRLGDDELRANAENGVGAVHYARGAYAQARACYGVALEAAREEGTRAKALLNLGVIANIQGEYADARALYERSRDAFRRARDAAGLTLVLHNLGMLHADQEHWDEAEEAYQECLRLAEQQGNTYMVANVLVNRSEVLSARGALEDAIAQCERAIVIYTEFGDEAGRAESLRWYGHALRRLGEHAAAERALTEAVRTATRLQAKLLEGEASRELGALRRAMGDAEGAARWLGRALETFTALDARREAAEVEQELEITRAMPGR